jgi:glutathione S-transferase
MSPSLKLVSFELCPFVQRSVIALEEKGAAYEIDYIDLTAKPEWFLELSPTGKVPLLLVQPAEGQQVVLFESSVIAEYIDETLGDERLHPVDPLERALHRGYVELASALTGDMYRLTVATDEESLEQARAAAQLKLERVLALWRGPFFAGERLSLVDAALAPALQRLRWCEELRAELGLVGQGKAAAYCDALLARPSVVASTVPDIHERFMRYIGGDRGQNKRNEQPSVLLGSAS